MHDTLKLIHAYMSSRTNYLMKHLGESSCKASLAELRRGVGRKPGELPAIWGEFLNGIPEELCGKDDEPSRAEWAVYVALTMLALHQQGHASPMHKKKIPLGEAASMLVSTEDDIEKVLKRLTQASQPDDIETFAHHLRNLIYFFRQSGISLDYIQLAEELYLFQNPNNANSIRLKWARDFFKASNTKFNKSTIEKENNNHENGTSIP